MSTGQPGEGAASFVAFSSGAARRDWSRSLAEAHNSAFARLDQDSSYQDWFQRNGYPPRAFGIGYGFDGDVAHGGHHDGYGPGHDRSHAYSWFGLHVNIGRPACRYPSSYHYSSWHSYSRAYFAPAYYPVYYGTSAYVYRYPYYVDYTWPGYSSHNTYNYYYDSGGSIGTAVPYTSTTTGYYGGSPSASGAARGAPATAPAGPYRYSHRRAGVQAFYSGDYALARREFVRALLAEPDDPEVVMLYGYAHFATGDYLVAALAIRRALRDDPTLIDSPVDIYRLYGAPDELAAHMDALDEHLTRDPADRDARFLAGFVRYAAGQTEEAADVFARCVSEAPDDLLCLIMRDAALRAEVLQRATEPAVTREPTPASQPTSPEKSESVPESF